ncbi:hypothetical protein AGR7C_Lc10041 [Agrobacterium deltaense Zutra 3/1]|uniref:Uncharacterized protein n=1 Tax=Agrobacterium deltaense Zutra 3/1 TaxID=1183427 RepID=A0A1S7QNA4_9HYPH|nr:hypothetical protein AGR7C_Lc10041 [Agrobacterium deltaense Zutra 3/1]
MVKHHAIGTTSSALEVNRDFARSLRHAPQCNRVPYVVERAFESGSRGDELRFDDGDFRLGPVLFQQFETLFEHLRDIGLDHIDREGKE